RKPLPARSNASRRIGGYGPSPRVRKSGRSYERGSRAATPVQPRSVRRRPSVLDAFTAPPLASLGATPDTGSALDQPESNISMERTQALAVPCPARAPGPCAAEGPGHQANPLEMRATDVAELSSSAAGFHAVRRPHARLRHGRSLRLASEALPTKRGYGRSDDH